MNDTTLSAASDTVSVYYDTAKFRVVDDADRQTVLCLSEDCRELHINDKRHYAWTFQNNTSRERIRILGAHLASGNTTKDHLNRAKDLVSIRTTLEENKGYPTFLGVIPRSGWPFHT